VLPPGLAWQRLLQLQDVLAEQPELARAVRRLPLCDQLAMTVELLLDSPETAEALPANVILFRRPPGR
jgi:hypothetical protein